MPTSVCTRVTILVFIILAVGLVVVWSTPMSKCTQDDRGQFSKLIECAKQGDGVAIFDLVVTGLFLLIIVLLIACRIFPELFILICFPCWLYYNLSEESNEHRQNRTESSRRNKSALISQKTPWWRKLWNRVAHRDRPCRLGTSSYSDKSQPLWWRRCCNGLFHFHRKESSPESSTSWLAADSTDTLPRYTPRNTTGIPSSSIEDRSSPSYETVDIIHTPPSPISSLVLKNGTDWQSSRLALPASTYHPYPQ